MLQIITLDLEITAADYLAWAHEPDADEAYGLVSARIESLPLGDTVTAVLDWDDAVDPPTLASAAAAAGLRITADVSAVSVTTCPSRAACLALAA